MKIELDKEKKIVLLKALKNGYIELEDIENWCDVSSLTESEILKEVNKKIKENTYQYTCRTLKELGLCFSSNMDLSILTDEELNAFYRLSVKVDKDLSNEQKVEKLGKDFSEKSVIMPMW